MKKLNKSLITLFVLFLLALSLFACAPTSECPPHPDADGNGICDNCGKLADGIDLSTVSMSGAEYFYDGVEHSLAIKGALPDGITVTYEGNGKCEVGSHTVTAKLYYNGNYLAGYDLEATLKIKPLSELLIPDVTMSSKEVTYNGKAHSLAILGTLPEDVTVEYTGNAKTDAGDYTITAKFYYKGVYIEGRDLTAALSIDKCSLDEDIADLGFASSTVAYDGEVHSILVEGNVPGVVEVTYEGNGKSEMGEHTVYAVFTLTDTDNYILTTTRREAKLNIISPTVAAGLRLDGKEVVFDGNAHSVAVLGLERLPLGTTLIGYDGNGQTNVGNYTVTAKFAVNGVHEPSLDMTADLVIKPATIEANIENRLIEKVFDGTPVIRPSIVWGDTKQDNISVTITGVSSAKYPGTYTIRYSFAPVSGMEGNYKAKDDIVVTIKIAHSGAFVTEGLKYSLVNGNYQVVGYEGTSPVVVIPSTYTDGTTEAPVTSIAKNTFQDKAIEYVYLPDTLDFIGSEAFSGCTALVSIRMSKNLATLGQAALRNTAIREISLPDTVISVGYAALEGAEALEAIRIPFVGGSRKSSNNFFGYIFGATYYSANDDYVPDTLKSIEVGGNCTIPEHAFYGLSGVTSITLSSGIEEIGIRAFYNCSALVDIYIPSTVTKIAAEADAMTSPFYGCSPELLIVYGSAGMFGKYFNYVTTDKTALVIYNKSYEDYLMNKDEYRIMDTTDATLAGIARNGESIDGFDPTTTEYEIEVDMNVGYGDFAVIPNSPVATVTITEEPTSANGGRLVVTVVSGDGTVTKTYTVKCKVVGNFISSADITVKGGAEGTVVYVVDDGYKGTATYCKQKMQEISNLAISFAVKTEKFATLTTEVGEDGIVRYVMDEDGNYTYTISQEQSATIDFWRDILDTADGRAEIVSHTHTHSPWGYNDLGGSYVYTNSGSVKIKDAPEGNLSKEIYASRQILMDVLGQPGLAMVTAGIAQSSGAVTLSADYSKVHTNLMLRLEADALVNVAGTQITLSSDTEMLLNPITVTIPAGTVITTTADIVEGRIANGSVVTVASATISIPEGTVINGYNDNYYPLCEEAIEDGALIGVRLTGGKTYVASQFADNVDTRMKLMSYMITSKTSNDASLADTWTGYIDEALKNGGITAFCIHAIVDDVTAGYAVGEENQGGHKISKAQADKLFAYTEELGDRVWVAELTDAMLYYYEWSTATATSSYSDGKVTVSLTDRERDDIFTMPLTVKVSVPAIWDSAVTDDGTALEICENDDGTRYVLVDVAPESSVVISQK